MRITTLFIGLVLMLIVPFITFASFDRINDPVNILRSKDASITQQQINRFATQQDLDKPLNIRYSNWLKRAVKGNFGIFQANGESAFPLLMMFLASLLAGIAALFALKKPLISMILFCIGAIVSFISTFTGFPGMSILGVVLLLLAVFSYFGHKELHTQALNTQP